MDGQCEKAAKILRTFLADPAHPESALNAIPKEVLLRAKGLVSFSVIFLNSHLSIYPPDLVDETKREREMG